MRSFYYLLQLLFAGLAAAQCNTYAVANVTGGFRTRQFVDFSTAQAGQSASTLLSNNGFSISDWPVTDTPPAISHTFVPGNVALTNGALSLKVNAYSGSGNVIGAEFSTNAEFKYVSVRTVQKSSSVPGVCEGNFFYKDQVAEIDFEILTSTVFQSSLACVPPGIWATTHPFKEGVESYSETFPFPFDPRADFHEYRVDFIQIAAQSKEVCDRYKIPLIINDRVDVALAVGASGVHVGQDDMDVELVRKLLPAGSIVGLSCNTPEQVKEAVKLGVDYVGIGAVWGTKTKNVTSPIIGTRGVGERLKELDGTTIKAVAIGGIKTSNLWRTLYGGVSVTGHVLDGVAVVSEIVASQDPRGVATALGKIVKAFKSQQLLSNSLLQKNDIVDKASELIGKTRDISPLVHQITNNVVATQSANVTLAVGASPIMATEPEEMEDLSKICGALLVNIGTMRADGLEGMRLAGRYANKYRKPIVFDPVGVGLLDLWQVGVIKGNAGELAALAGTSEVLSRGVDSVGSGFKDPVSFVQNLAKRERCVVVLTGPTDYISDGTNVAVLQNGDNFLGKITGSGCILGSIIASYSATALHGVEVLPNEESRLVDLERLFIAAITGYGPSYPTARQC
ncbi:hypothetical protein D9611_000486 [Ephemerocybe angulata]|uniref:Thiamine phosphate synthase/TenI domain-containing protein n=1 Tax=Ephemerocybe angulata TaxID=980116 RepID=A0A8H5F7Q4_9AGAR|nr:hypothetical protein D9611_000486 [Tulosesus angulatus]